MTLKDAYSLVEKLWPTYIVYSKAETLLCRLRSFCQGYGFSCGHVWMWGLDHKESWAPKNWCFWTMVLEKTLESPLDCKEIQPVHPKGNQSWVFIGRTDVEAEAPIFWPPDVKNWFTGKDPDAGKDWRREEKGMTEDEMVGWHHWLNGHEFEQTSGDSEGQGSPAAVHGVVKSRARLSNWTELSSLFKCRSLLNPQDHFRRLGAMRLVSLGPFHVGRNWGSEGKLFTQDPVAGLETRSLWRRPTALDTLCTRTVSPPRFKSLSQRGSVFSLSTVPPLVAHSGDTIHLLSPRGKLDASRQLRRTFINPVPFLRETCFSQGTRLS